MKHVLLRGKPNVLAKVTFTLREEKARAVLNGSSQHRKFRQQLVHPVT